MIQINFKELLEKAVLDLDKTEKVRKRKFAVILGSEFKELFTIKLNHQMRLRRKSDDFKFDENNEELINQLFFYLIGNDSKFKGDLEKGIMVLGNLGSGKTIIVNAFCSMWDDLFNLKIKSITAKKYVELLLDPEKFRSVGGILPDYGKGTVFIDDIAKESKKVNVYGTEICPMADLLAERYDNGVLTFMTGNYTLDSLKSQYGETITDRMKEMFNIIVLKGDSRRK